MNTTITILAKGAPNRCRDGQKTICAIGLSDEFGLLRLYPFSADDELSIWDVVEIRATKSTTDNRAESYRIESWNGLAKVNDADRKRALLNDCILKSGTEDPIAYQNKQRASIAIVLPLSIGVSLRRRIEEDALPNCTDPELASWVNVQADFNYKPYAIWTSHQGGNHESHIVAQEAYMGMLNNQVAPTRIFENMRLLDADYEKWFVLGNMRDRRQVWVIAHAHRLKKTPQATMLANFQTNDGRNDGWPYLHQEDGNARRADPQMKLQFTT